MCGIFGWITTDKKSLIDSDKAESLTRLLNHRGPDATGFYKSERCFLGHTRLKIIDLSDLANQPFSDSTGRYQIVLNGEIYNYLELREELEKEGIQFRTKSDTEVLLYSFILWGKGCLQKLEGMFAFAVFDKNKHALFLCRDHLGQKPLYYTFQNGNFIFASELRCIIEHPAVTNYLDINNILKYHIYDVFAFDTTPVQGVKKLLPGNYLEIKNGSTVIQKYWDSIPGEHESNLSFDDALEHLDELMTRSLNMHMRSDVPFGVFLSGGIDSSLITFYAKKILQGKELRSFSIAVDCENFNEGPVAEMVSSQLGCNSQLFNLNEQGVSDAMNVMFSCMDEPLADPGLLNSYFLAKNARDHIKVALVGDGGDELFGGYVTFKAVPWLKRLQSYLPGRLFPVMAMLAKKLIINKNKYMSMDFKLTQFMKGYSVDDLIRLPMWLASLTSEDIQRLYKKEFLTQYCFHKNSYSDTLFFDLQKASGKVKGKSLFDIMLYQYQKYFLPEFVLAHTDRASMRTSLEVRCPFVDKSIIEFANKLPLDFKIKNSQLKKILTGLMGNLNFSQPVLRHKKQGFTFPVASWLQGSLSKKLVGLLSPPENDPDDIWNWSYITKMVNEHLSGKENHYRALWNIMVLLQWRRNYPYLRFPA